MTNIIVKMNYTLVVQICQEGMKKSGRKSELLSLPLGKPYHQVFVRIACTVMKERNVHSIIIVQPLTGWNGSATPSARMSCSASRTISTIIGTTSSVANGSLRRDAPESGSSSASSGSGHSGSGNTEGFLDLFNEVSKFKYGKRLYLFNDSSDFFGCHFSNPPKINR
mgnify:CR=1 FL=1